MFILGLDIGYSNLKLSFGSTNEDLKTRVLPIGAAPTSYLPMRIGKASKAGDLQVMINDEPWAAGIEPSRLEGWERELHANYPSTDSYLALYYAAILSTGQKEIDLVVTGLPVNQYLDSSVIEALKKRLKGTHQINKHLAVTVKEAVIVPQPIGAFANVVSTEDESLATGLESGNTIVIDPGFFSVDWVLIKNSELHKKSSGTSLKAMSMLLTNADLLIQKEYGTTVGVEALERTVRSGNTNMQIFGNMVDIESFIEQAAKELASTALTPMRKTMREESAPIDHVLLTGGGASLYANAAKEIFPKAKITVCKQSVLANALGFFYLGLPD